MLKSIKFGGSSLGDAQSILKCRDIITKQLNDGHIIVVTTSAMFNVTNKGPRKIMGFVWHKALDVGMYGFPRVSFADLG